LDIHQHDQCAHCPRLTHGSLDLQRNDRLGRRRSHQRFEHRREILRPIWSNANPDTDFNRDANFNGNRNSYTHAYANTDGNSDSNGYAYTDSYAKPYPNPDGYVHSCADTYGYSYPDCDTYSHSYADPKPYSDSYPHTNADGNAWFASRFLFGRGLARQ
jgi:hypothetical protein